MKKIKWFLFIILIISILVTVILFINFTSDKNNNGNIDNNIENKEEFSVLDNLYNKEWYIISLTVTDNNVELFRNDSYDNQYIVIDKETIKYCNVNDIDCKIDDYVYQNNKISISTKNTIGAGDYEVKYIKGNLALSTKESGKTVTYYFEEGKG